VCHYELEVRGGYKEEEDDPRHPQTIRLTLFFSIYSCFSRKCALRRKAPEAYLKIKRE
jgi:hypothetical protein